MKAKSIPRIQTLLNLLTKPEKKQLQEYIKSAWNVAAKYEWMAELLACYINDPANGMQTWGFKNNSRKMTPTIQKNFNGKLASKIKEFLSLKQLERNKDFLDLLLIMELSYRTTNSIENSRTQVFSLLESIGEAFCLKWGFEKKALLEFQAQKAITKAQVDGNSRNQSLSLDFTKMTKSLDQFYLKEKLKVVCAKITNERVIGSAIISNSERKHLKALIQFANSFEELNDPEIKIYCQLLNGYLDLSLLTYAQVSSLVNDLKEAKGLSAETLAPTYGMIHNLITDLVKDGREEFNLALWELYCFTVTEGIIITNSGKTPVSVARNLLVHGIKIGMGNEAINILARLKTKINFIENERSSFFLYGCALRDYFRKWQARNFKISGDLLKLHKISFSDDYLQIGLVDLMFRVSFHLGYPKHQPEDLLEKLKLLVSKSTVLSVENRIRFEIRNNFYELLLPNKEVSKNGPNDLIKEVQSSKLEKTDKEWIIAMIK